MMLFDKLHIDVKIIILITICVQFMLIADVIVKYLEDQHFPIIFDIFRYAIMFGNVVYMIIIIRMEMNQRDYTERFDKQRLSIFIMMDLLLIILIFR